MSVRNNREDECDGRCKSIRVFPRDLRVILKTLRGCLGLEPNMRACKKEPGLISFCNPEPLPIFTFYNDCL